MEWKLNKFQKKLLTLPLGQPLTYELTRKHIRNGGHYERKNDLFYTKIIGLIPNP